MIAPGDLRNRLRTARATRKSAASDDLVDAKDFLVKSRARTDRWFFLVRMLLGLGLLGYLVVDLSAFGGITTSELSLVAGYLVTNLMVWAAADRLSGNTRWLFAGVDITFFVLQRHLFLFEATVDPNTTLVGFFSLLLIAYVSYSDPRLVGTMALVMVVSVGSAVWLDVLRLDNPQLGPVLGEITFRTRPLRILLQIGFLSTVGLISFVLARRLCHQFAAYGDEMTKRARAAMHTAVIACAQRTRMHTAVERARRERLEELNDLKRNFIAILSHELRTPITPLRTSLELVNRELDGNAATREVLGIAMEAFDRLQRLIQDYVRLAELLTLDGAEQKRCNFRMIDLLEAILPEGTEQRLLCVGVEDLTISGDPRLLGGAILALVRRAELVTPEHEAISVSGQSEGASSFLSIHDPTSFLDAESTKDLSDPFAYSSERTFMSGNTGLELILAQHSVERVGGGLTVDSSPENGTTVHVRLPQARSGDVWLGDEELRDELSYLVL